MPIVNYVREHIRFMEYACDEKLSSSERLLWYALMHIMNQRAQGNVWPDDFIRISNERLLSLCPMKFDTMANARNGLKQRGLIEVEKGEKNKKSPAYRMIYFYPQYLAPDTAHVDGRVYPEISDNMGYNVGDNMGYNQGDNMGYNPGSNPGDFSINYTGIPIPETKHVTIPPLVNPHEPEDDDQTDNQEHRLLRAREEVKAAWQKHYGHAPNPAIVDHIASMAVSRFEFAEGIISKAVNLAATKMVSSPTDYITWLFMDWGARHNIKSTDDLDDYLDERWDAKMGW